MFDLNVKLFSPAFVFLLELLIALNQQYDALDKADSGRNAWQDKHTYDEKNAQKRLFEIELVRSENAEENSQQRRSDPALYGKCGSCGIVNGTVLRSVNGRLICSAVVSAVITVVTAVGLTVVAFTSVVAAVIALAVVTRVGLTVIAVVASVVAAVGTGVTVVPAVISTVCTGVACVIGAVAACRTARSTEALLSPAVNG